MEPNKELEQVMEKKFLTPAKFAMEIESIVSKEDMNYIDAIIFIQPQFTYYFRFILKITFTSNTYGKFIIAILRYII